MLGQISPDMMRSYQEFTASGQHKNINRENLARFQRSQRDSAAKVEMGGEKGAPTHFLEVFLASMGLRASRA